MYEKEAAHTGPIGSLSVCPFGDKGFLLATGSYDTSVKLWCSTELELGHNSRLPTAKKQ